MARFVNPGQYTAVVFRMYGRNLWRASIARSLACDGLSLNPIFEKFPECPQRSMWIERNMFVHADAITGEGVLESLWCSQCARHACRSMRRVWELRHSVQGL